MALRDAVTALDAGLTGLFWEVVHADVRRRLEATRPARSTDLAGLPEEELHAYVANAEAYLAAMQSLLAELPQAEALWSTASVEPPVLPARPRVLADPVIAVEVLAAEAAGWGALVRAVDPEAVWASRSGPAGVHDGRFRYDGVAVRALWEPGDIHRNEGPDGVLALGVSMPRASEPMRLRSQSWGDELLSALGLRRDVRLGEDLFDGYFVVDAEPEVARAYLPAEVRAGLLRVALEDVPRVDVGPEGAVVSWGFAPSGTVLQAALGCLVAWHRMPPTRRFRT